MKFTRILSLLPVAAVTTAVMLGSCAGNGHKEGVALTGHLATDSVEDFMLNYYVEGDLNRPRTIELKLDENGNFEIPDSLIPAEGVHAQILADDNGLFGVWLEPGKTAGISISGNPSEGMTAEFSGENADINDVYNDITRSFDIMVYTPQDPSERMPKEKALARLSADRKRIADKAAALNDKKKADYYSRLIASLADRMEGFVLEDEAYDVDANPIDNPRYKALIAKVDPNDDVALESGMVYVWLFNRPTDPNLGKAATAVAQLKSVDALVKNARTRKALYNTVASHFFAYSQPTPEEANEFMKSYAELAKDFPEFIDAYTMRAQSTKEIKIGDTINYDPMIATADGKTCKLSSLYGKLLYIDFWATWCGPCCKQIPHLEKLVEKMKGVEGIEFISVSCDTDIDAWKAKIAKDKPEWPQYIFSGKDGDNFMTSMNINGIPRFMIIAPDGKILDVNAPMPSDPKLEDTLKGYLK